MGRGHSAGAAADARRLKFAGPALARCSRPAVVVRAPSQAQSPQGSAACSFWPAAQRDPAITSCSCDSLLFQHSALEQHPRRRLLATPLQSTHDPATPVRTLRTPATSHGFSQVGCRLGDGQGPAVPLHLRRQGRPRPLHLDAVQRHATSMSPSTTVFLSVYFWGARLTFRTAGRRLELQHLLVRHHRQPICPPPRQERPEEAADAATPRRHKSAGYGRGMLPAGGRRAFRG